MIFLTAIEGLLWCGTVPGALDNIKLKKIHFWLLKALKIRVSWGEGRGRWGAIQSILERGTCHSFGKRWVESVPLCSFRAIIEVGGGDFLSQRHGV